MNRLKIGVVGCGFIAGKKHIPCFLALRKFVDVKAVCDVEKAKALAVAKQFGVRNAYSSLSDMIQKEQLDVVDICTPPQTHASLAVEAAEHRCHVLLEKPMALNVLQCDSMIDASRRSGTYLSVIHNELFYPVVMKAERLVKKGKLGQLMGMRWLRLTPIQEYAAVPDHWVHKLPGGILGETGPHAVYTSIRFIGKVKDVYLVPRKISDHPWLLYDDYRIELNGEKASSSIIISHTTNTRMGTVEMFGTEGNINLDLCSEVLVYHRLEDLGKVSLALSSLSTAGQIVKGTMYNGLNMILGRGKFGHAVAIERFVKSITADLPPPVSSDEGRETVRIMELLVDKLDVLQRTG